MNKIWILVTISLLWVAFRSNQFFEDKFKGVEAVKASQVEERFFLPFPKDAKVISNDYQEEYLVIMFETMENYLEISGFYEEILRSKKYEKSYFSESQNFLEFQYLKSKEEINFVVSQSEDKTSVIIKYKK